MSQIAMSTDLLNLIYLIQAKKDLSIAESLVGLHPDWSSNTRNYYNKLSPDFFKSLGLTKNLYLFNSILDFKITPEMKSCDSSDLKDYTFIYQN